MLSWRNSLIVRFRIAPHRRLGRSVGPCPFPSPFLAISALPTRSFKRQSVERLAQAGQLVDELVRAGQLVGAEVAGERHDPCTARECALDVAGSVADDNGALGGPAAGALARDRDQLAAVLGIRAECPLA